MSSAPPSVPGTSTSHHTVTGEQVTGTAGAACGPVARERGGISYAADLVLLEGGADRPVLRHPRLGSAVTAASWVLDHLESLPNTRMLVTLRRCDDTEPVFTGEGGKQHLLDELRAWRDAHRRIA
uniref:hypothetical protein n=1 Tax=Nocardia suismassiliense TaxID=2077092 RepID=UPI003F493EEB